MPIFPPQADFEREIHALRDHPLLKPLISRGEVAFKDLSRADVAELLRHETAYYFLIAAAQLNRTSLKAAAQSDEARILPPKQRPAFAVTQHLPLRKPFADVANAAVALRVGDLRRASRGSVEKLFRERLEAEGIPILMSPPVRRVPGILISGRKPDGVFPDPATGSPPLVYLEIKNVRRVADDIQKRLYEIAEASIEMKLLYGGLRLDGLSIASTTDVTDRRTELQAHFAGRIRQARPTVVALLLCARVEAERYRGGAEAFVDRVFFTEEIDACVEFLKAAVKV